VSTSAAEDVPNDTEPSSRCDVALISEAGNCTVAKIVIGKRRRALDPVKVDDLAASIRRVGLRHPITVTPMFEGDVEAGFRRGKKVYADQMRLVAGLHRLEAVKKLGWRTIPVSVIPHRYPLHCELWEIDENLARAELTELERGEHLADRKAIYEQLHPETKAGAAQALGMNRALGNDVSDKLAPTFTADTAAKTGLSQRAIERAIHRAENITPEIEADAQSLTSTSSPDAHPA
jgi:ParB family chromosome partitioning protein